MSEKGKLPLSRFDCMVSRFSVVCSPTVSGTLPSNRLASSLTSIKRAGQAEPFFDLLARFHKTEVDDMTWAALKIAAGQAALLVKNIPKAVEEFRTALGAADLLQRARACYHLAKTLEKRNYRESLSYYERGIELCEPSTTAAHDTELCFDLYIGKSWLHIQESQDLTAAAASIQAAAAFLPDLDAGRCSDLYNAWAGYYWKQRDQSEELNCRYRAYVAALESQDNQRIVKTAHNLGQTYCFTRNASQIQTGLTYLREALALAQTIGDRIMEGKCHQASGVGFFFMQQYAQAITHYASAYQVFRQVADRNWLGWACHDLAEVHVMDSRSRQDEAQRQQQMRQARRYFAQAQQIDEQLGARDLHSALAHLAAIFPELVVQLNERQTRALAHIDQHGLITNRAYRTLNSCGRSTAGRDLDELVVLGLVVEEGDGRSTHYRRRHGMDSP